MMASIWPILLTMILGGLAVYMLLPRPESRFPRLPGAIAAAAAIVLAGWLLTRVTGAPTPAVLFYAFSGIAVLSGGMLVTQHNPVHAALSFASVVLSTCGLFLLQAAPFLMAATIIVYAGAIVVTFLFVIMLAQQAGVSDADLRSREPLLSTVASFVLLGALLYVLQATFDTGPLDDLRARAARALEQNTIQGMHSAIGDDGRFFSELRRESDRLGGGSERTRALKDGLDRLEEIWRRPAPDLTEMRRALAVVHDAAGQAHDRSGRLEPSPAALANLSTFSVPRASLTAEENVAPLGRSLFTDYLLPVELAGTLLLVATIGAIAIAGRRTGELR